jgi:phage replication-related protein YjqB (UPF0714/DUF867 family)
MDAYASYQELIRNEKEGKDFLIRFRETGSGIAIMAPHGGRIESGTVDIADAIADNEYTFYAFQGIKMAGNRALHITSSRFDEPTGVKISENTEIVVTIHGCRERNETVYVGGRHLNLKERLIERLTAAGFQTELSKNPGLRGMSLQNLCNRCRSGRGIQIEISRGLRERLFEDLGRHALRKKRPGFYRFVEAVKASLHEMQG